MTNSKDAEGLAWQVGVWNRMAGLNFVRDVRTWDAELFPKAHSTYFFTKSTGYAIRAMLEDIEVIAPIALSEAMRELAYMDRFGEKGL